MEIQCTACRAVARIPSSKEGAKVRCPECGHVYVARPPGARGSQGPPPMLWIGGAGAIVLLGVLLYVRKASRSLAEAPPPAVEEEEQEEPEEAWVDEEGWDGAPVRAVRDLYAAAEEFNDGKAQRLLHAAGHADWREQRGLAAEAPFDSLDASGRKLALAEFARDALEDDGPEALGAWRPYDGRAVEVDPDAGRATVHVQVTPRSGGGEKLTMEFSLQREDGAWKVVSWQRWVDPNAPPPRVVAPKEYAKVELSDGSQVYEAEPRPLDHLADTPPDLRARIEDAYARMIDLAAMQPKMNASAKRELVDIGKPALPILLTGLYEIPLDTEDQVIQVNLINQALQEITGFHTGFEPQLAEGSSAGTTRERRDSAIRQWFAWWFRKGERFDDEAERPDLLEELIAPNERDLRQMEKDARDARGGR